MAVELRDIALRKPPPAAAIANVTDLRSALKQFARMAPRVVRVAPVGVGYLQVGIGGPWAFVEYCQDAPWDSRAALPDPSWLTEEPPEQAAFACGGEESEIPGEYLMPAGRAISLVARIVRSGVLPNSVDWESQ